MNLWKWKATTMVSSEKELDVTSTSYKAAPEYSSTTSAESKVSETVHEIPTKNSLSVTEISEEIKNLHGDRHIFKTFCFKTFTQEELMNRTRTGKRTIKCNNIVKPQLDTEKFGILEELVLQRTIFDKLTFHKKFENLQK